MAQSWIVEFGEFSLNLQTGDLISADVISRLQDQPFRALSMLIETPGQLVTREQLRQRLWPDQTYLNFDNALATAMKKLRKALSDDPDRPRFIETLPKRGYRFLAEVTRSGDVIETVSTLPDDTLTFLQQQNQLLRSIVADLTIDRETLKMELAQFRQVNGKAAR